MTDLNALGGTNPAILDQYRSQFQELSRQFGIPDITAHMQGLPPAAGAAPTTDQLAQRTTRFGLGTAPTETGPAVTTPLSARATGQRVRITGGGATTTVDNPEEQRRYMALDNGDTIKDSSGRSLSVSELRTNIRGQAEATEPALPAGAPPADVAARSRRVDAAADQALERDYGIHRVVNADGTDSDRYAIRRVNPATGQSRLSTESQGALTAYSTALANPTTRSGPGAAAPGSNTLDYALRNAGGLGGLGLTGLASGMTGMGALSMSSVAMNAANGLQFQMRKQLRSTASNFGDYGMIAMINSPGISIESLIYYFMAYMSDKYEDKLREKMEEVVIQEQRERNMQQRRDAGELLGGIAGLMVGGGVGGILGASGGSSIGAALGRTAADTLNSVEGALSGSSKSTTVLMQEVQILVQNWKMIMDMTSNLSKTLHEMAMTAVRNIR